MPKIVVTRNIGPDAMSLFDSSPFEIVVNPDDAAAPRAWVLKHLADPDVQGICVMHADTVNQEFLDHCNPNLKVISTLSVGFDHIDVAGANKKGIKVGHTPGVLSDAVADITTMLVLMTMRRVEEGVQLVKSGEWPSLPWGPFVMCGPSISADNLTISFLGFGRISHEVLKRLLVFTSKSSPPTILYHSSRARENQADLDADFSRDFGLSVKRVEVDELAAKADILVVLCSMNKDTINLVNSTFLQKMKKSAILVNAARGPIVNSEDLAEALDNGTIYGAGLDVITGEPHVKADHPLVLSKRCVVLPHMGSADFDTRKKMASLCVRNAIAGASQVVLPAEVKL
ncbi:hypothetical protein P7C73_g5046, partial [Tremellales sp. Uapishka_1]